MSLKGCHHDIVALRVPWNWSEGRGMEVSKQKRAKESLKLMGQQRGGTVEAKLHYTGVSYRIKSLLVGF